MRARAGAGFALLELLVALAVLAVLAAISYRGLGAVLGAEAAVQAESRRWNEVAALFAQMGRDFSLAVARPARDGAGSARPAFLLADGAVELTRLGDPEGGAAQSPPRRVGYRLSERRVEYLVWPALDAAPGAQPQALPVLERVAQLRLRALAPGGAWAAAWPAAGAEAALPAAVEARVLLEDGGEVVRLFPVR